MLRIATFTCLLLLSCLCQASQPMYQVDMIVFARPGAQQANTVTTPLAPDTQHAIPLQYNDSGAQGAYHLLPASLSQLSGEYWALNHKTNYQVLAHYTWRQPANNQRAVALSANGRYGWNVEGTLRIRRSNYYLLDTELLFSDNNQTAFLFSQKQRLKPGTVYYLDHPQAGMLIKVHQVA